jgi:hypothetical protein
VGAGRWEPEMWAGPWETREGDANRQPLAGVYIYIYIYTLISILGAGFEESFIYILSFISISKPLKPSNGRNTSGRIVPAQ